MRRSLAALVLALAAPAAVLAQASKPKPGDLVNNPPYAHWSQFAVGTSVTTKEVVTLADGSVAEAVVTSKLIAKSKDALSVETTVEAGAAGKRAGEVERTKTVAEFPAKVKFEQANTPASAGYAITEGKELVAVKGKQVETEWTEATVTSGDETVTEKVWTARDIPGGIVKQTLTKKRGGKVASHSELVIVEYQATPEVKTPAKP